MNSFLNAWKNCITFTGRARRTEYWEFHMINFGFCLLLAFLGIGVHVLIPLAYLYALASNLPSLAVKVRRMHDLGKSGWFVLVELIPLIGTIWVFILTCTAGEEGSNRFGDDPKLEDTFGRKEDNQEMGEGI